MSFSLKRDFLFSVLFHAFILTRLVRAGSVNSQSHPLLRLLKLNIKTPVPVSHGVTHTNTQRTACIARSEKAQTPCQELDGGRSRQRSRRRPLLIRLQSSRRRSPAKSTHAAVPKVCPETSEFRS
jgi:hypothetical protein